MSKIKIPIDELQEKILCGMCNEDIIERKSPVRLRIYISNNTIDRYFLCDQCLEKLNIPKSRVIYLRLLNKFKKYNKLYFEEDWTKEATEIFIDYLGNNNLEIRNYGISICNDENFKPVGILDLIKKHNINKDNGN